MAVLLLVLTYNGSQSPGAAEASTALAAGHESREAVRDLPHPGRRRLGRGNVGPSLDGAKPTYEEAVEIVTNGQGAMPAFGEQPGCDEKKIECVATYVSSVTNGAARRRPAAGGAPRARGGLGAGVTSSGALRAGSPRARPLC